MRYLYIFNKPNDTYVEKRKIVHKNINLGIQILRMILCFWVLSFHCIRNNKRNYYIYYLIKTKFFHVPCFTFISFYFSYKIFLDRNIIQLRKRLERLLIPYTLWPILIFIFNNILNSKKITLHDLMLQLLLGTQFISPLWYLSSVSLLTIFFLLYHTYL